MKLPGHGRLTPWLFMAPALLTLALVGLYPLFMTFFTSFTDAELGASVDEWKMVGLRQYRALATDGDFLAAAVNTLRFSSVSVFLELVLGLGIAIIVKSEFRGRGMVRTAMLLPWALPTVVSARLWSWMFNDHYGVLNDVLVTKLHVLSHPISVLARPSTAMSALIAIDVWKTTPFMALLLLAGLTLIPDDVYEAARVDGASRWQQVWHVTLPLLKPTILVAVLFRSMDALRVFDLIKVTTSGSLDTESLGTYVYRQIVDFQKLGYGSAVSVAVFAILGFLALLQAIAIGPGEKK